MLVAILMLFFVLSFTGVAILDVAYTSKTSSLTTSKNIRMQYLVESTVNEAMWRINSGADSLVNRSEDGLLVMWDEDSQMLRVDADTLGMEYSVNLVIDESTPFDFTFSYVSGFSDRGYSFDSNLSRPERQFKEIPKADLPYFAKEAVAIHKGNQNSWENSNSKKKKGEDFTSEGIHVFTGNNLVISDLILYNSTLVFTGKNIVLDNCIIAAPYPSESSLPIPAIVLTNKDATIQVKSNNRIEGAIYSSGMINLANAELTGPFIADYISLDEDLEFIADDRNEFFQWSLGFGDQSSIDWPKFIDRWNTTDWLRKKRT